MNRRSIFTLFFCLFTLSIFAQDNILGLKTGSRITYDVVGAEPGNSKTFVITIKSISSSQIVYDWVRGNVKGTVTLKGDAVAATHRIQNAFGKSSKLTYTDRASIILSRQAFQDLIQSGQTNLFVNGAKATTNFQRFMERDYDILVNGKKVTYKAILAVNQEGKTPKVVLALNDSNFPLMLGMDLDFRIALKAVDNP
jgi:hypothetical protein